ncbi:MAG: hypothetical protein U0P45_07835 [Acidimicrobiales bacterium]
MASWNELRGFIQSNYKVAEDKGELLSMIFSVGERSQAVLIGLAKNQNTGEEWVQISSPIGPVATVDLEAASRAAFDWLCGGIVVVADMVYLHHAAPLANLDTNEFVRPLTVIVDGADQLESTLLGTDEF